MTTLKALHGSQTMGRRSLVVAATTLMAIGVVGIGSASSAHAAEAKPLAITKFTMQTTAPTKEVLVGEQSNGKIFEFLNEPSRFTQAGGHPWALTTTVEFAGEELENQEKEHLTVPTRDPRDIVIDLPPGLLGDPMAVPRCSLSTLASSKRCPASTQVGVYRIRWFGGKEALYPIVNMVPEAGQSAEFALENEIKLVPILTAHLVHTAQGYGFTAVSNKIPEVELMSIETTFWGVPADPSHDAMRGLFCSTVNTNPNGHEPLRCNNSPGLDGNEPAGVTPMPFLTMPTDCAAGPETGSARADSWQEPGRAGVDGTLEGYVSAEARMPAVTGCDVLSFDPSIEVQPDESLADAPVGLGVDLRVPLDEAPGANATPQLRDTRLALPEGLSVSPGVVDGIQACNATGPEGINIEDAESEEPGLNGEPQLASGHCPSASTVGTAEAITPFLPVPVKGHVYLARPSCGGAGQPECTEADAAEGRLYRLYLELGGEGELASTGVHFKVPLETLANPVTGQLTTRALNTLQAPFSELKIHLNGGPRAPLDNPPTCGPAVTTSDLTPWSAPGTTPEGLLSAGTADATPSAFYDVSGCASPVGLSPGFSAGTVSPQAGAFSPFTLTFTRRDREQFLSGIQVHTPAGLLGMLSSVPLCGEPQAQSGHCPESSKIGTTRVASGAGSHPFEIGGNVYLTTGYQGAPFGLSIVTDAIAGPFNLGLVVVRARIDVDPETSQLTVTSDPLPQIVFGVPLRLKQVTVNIDRAGFMFNPTSCGAQKITAVVSGNQNAIADVSSPFAAAGCKSLAFKPKFTVTTSGHTSKADGASLDAKLSFPAGSVGSEANIARVKVDLPKQLPSRLTTLQKACTAATFAANPANCPAASIVGIVRASTPLLPVGLSGPVYFVSHGGEAFPSLIVVLQGDGVRVDLTGSTFISRTGITSSTFKTVPDVPVSTFEIYLPEGKYSALAANGNLCTSKLSMPTEFLAQNGAVVHQSTKITATNCPKAKKTKTKAKKQKKQPTPGHGRTSK
jgi:hypothetical protein